MAEARTPSYQYNMHSPRVGGCVSSFFQFFDWNPAKRFSSTKRLPAVGGLEKSVRRSRSFRHDHNNAANTALVAGAICGGRSPVHAATSETRGGMAVVKHCLHENQLFCDASMAACDDTINTRVPGVVARLMGLDSLPDGPYHPCRHRRTHSHSGSESHSHLEDDENHLEPPPVLLQDLLNRDMIKTSKRSLKDKFPGFARRPAQEQQAEMRGSKKGSSPASALTSLRCRAEESLSPYADQRRPKKRSVYVVSQKERDEKQPFLARLSPPVLLPSKAHNQMTSPATANTSTNKGADTLQGWPLAGPHRSCDQNEPASSVKPEQDPQSEGERCSSRGGAKSKRFTSNASKLLHGRPISRTWNGRDDCSSESLSERTESSAIVRGSVSFRESRSVERGGNKGKFVKSFSERPQSLSPPRHRQRRRPVNVKHVDAKEKAMALLGTHEASVREFKLNVRNAVDTTSSTGSVSVIRTHGYKKLGVSAEAAMEDEKSVSSSSQGSCESSQRLNTELPISVESPLAIALFAKNSKIGTTAEDSNSSSKTDRSRSVISCPTASSASKVKSKDGGIRGGEVAQHVSRRLSSSQVPEIAPATSGRQVSSGGFQGIKALQSPKGQQEKCVALSGGRVFPADGVSKANKVSHQRVLQGENLPKSMAGSILGYGKLFSARNKEGNKPAVVDKNAAANKISIQGGKKAENSLRSALRRESASPRCDEKEGQVTALNKHTRQHNLQDVGEARENPSISSNSRAGEMKPLRHTGYGDPKGEVTRAEVKFARQRKGVHESRTIMSRKISEVRYPTKHARARSIDDVFPEIPLDLDFTAPSSAHEKREGSGMGFDDDINLQDRQITETLQRRSIELVLENGIGVFTSPPHKRMSDLNFLEWLNEAGRPGALSSSPLIDYTFSSSPLVDYDRCRTSTTNSLAVLDDEEDDGKILHGEVRDLFTSGAEDDTHCADEIIESKNHSPLTGRNLEIRCSKESSDCVVLDDAEFLEDASNASVCYDQFEVPTPKVPKLEVASEKESLSPVVMRTDSEKVKRADVDVDETGQPSPVSVLESPFHDESCTTPEYSLAESERQPSDVLKVDNQLHLSWQEGEVSNPAASLPQISESEKLRQAILDISMFRSFDVYASEYSTELKDARGPQEEHKFVREVLTAARCLSSPGSSPNWFNQDLVIDPSLFDRLESGDTDQSDSSSAEDAKFLQRSGGLWRCDRKLLFDCINEAFALKLWDYKDPTPWIRGLVLNPRPSGQKLVEDVYDKIKEWRQLASSHTIDTLIDRDMNLNGGKWEGFSQEVAEVGLDVEQMLWNLMLEEVVVDLAGT